MRLHRNGTAVLDMTEGSIMPLLIRFALPVMLGSVFQEVYTLTDTMIAGYCLGDRPLAAIGATNTMYSLMVGFAVGMATGCGMVVARYFGAGDRLSLRKATGVMALVSAAAGLLLSAVTLLLTDPMMHLLSVPETIWSDARVYFQIISGGMLITVAYNACAGYMRALGNSRMPLIFLVLACLLNVGLDLLFVPVLGWGVAGAAWATLIAQGVSAALCLIYIVRKLRDCLPDRTTPRPPAALVREMLVSGMSIGAMSSVVAVGSVIMQSAINSLGDRVITAHTGARRLLSISCQAQSAVYQAGTTFAGQNMGAGKYRRVRQGILRVEIVEILSSLVIGLALILWGEPLFRLIVGTDNAEIIRLANMANFANGVMFIPLGVLCSLRTIMQAIGMTVVPVLAAAVELAMKAVFAIWIIPPAGYSAACWCEPSTWLACMVFVVAFYFIRRPSVYPDLRKAPGDCQPGDPMV